MSPTGPDLAGPDLAGPDLAGPDLAGPDLAGPDPAGPGSGCLKAGATAPLPPLPLLLVAAVAMVDVDGRVLIAQRPAGKAMAGLWEFPGGKVAEGETPEAALVRELREELGVDITESCLAPFTFASHRYAEAHLVMPLYLCRVWKGTPTPIEGQVLRWLRPQAMTALPMPPADAPLVAMLRDFL